MRTSALVLTLFLAWTLFLLMVMEALRSYLVVTGQVRSNAFKPDNSNISPFMQRHARAHANCVESLPVFGGLLLVVIATDQAKVTDTLAPWLLGARIAQSAIHMVSNSVLAVNARFAAFALQMGIGAHWAWKLLGLQGPGRRERLRKLRLPRHRVLASRNRSVPRPHRD